MCRSESEGWQVNYKQFLEGHKNCECYVFAKNEEMKLSCFQIKILFIVFSLCYFCVYRLSFALLTIIRTTKWQGKYINKASNINKIINYNYDIMAKIKI